MLSSFLQGFVQEISQIAPARQSERCHVQLRDETISYIHIFFASNQ
ncbi:hypothetical protein HMPREF3212_01453 [Citrobacter freundii]|nr:hypothetical protein HMPREF3212_01453 [Citrobacter freundii]